MADASVRRRGHGEDAIYFAADKNRYIGAVSVGFGPDGKRLRRKVSGKTKQEVRDKLRALHAELDVGLRSSEGYTVRAAVDDWLEHGLSGRSARTIKLYRDGVRPLTDRLGAGWSGYMCHVNRRYEAQCGWTRLGSSARWQPVPLRWPPREPA
jgi:hypothetical protein